MTESVVVAGVEPTLRALPLVLADADEVVGVLVGVDDVSVGDGDDVPLVDEPGAGVGVGSGVGVGVGVVGVADVVDAVGEGLVDVGEGLVAVGEGLVDVGFGEGLVDVGVGDGLG